MTKEEAIGHIKDIIYEIEQEPNEEIQGSTYGGVSWGGTYKPQEPKYCDRNICVSNEYNGIV